MVLDLKVRGMLGLGGHGLLGLHKCGLLDVEVLALLDARGHREKHGLLNLDVRGLH